MMLLTSLIFFLSQFIIGIVYASFMEWFIHKYILHGLGKKYKNSVWRFHFKQHHRDARKNKMLDLSYKNPWWKDSKRAKEVFGLVFLAIIHLPIAFYFFVSYCSLIVYLFGYYLVHKHSHLSKEWAVRWVPWHYMHHCSDNQESNWGVLLPLSDIILKTTYKDLKKKKYENQPIDGDF